MDEELSTLRKQCVESLQNSAGYILKYLDGTEKNNEINMLKTYVRSYCYLDKLSNLEEVQDYIDEQNDEICSYEDFEAKLSELGQNLDYNDHTYMRSFIDKIKSHEAALSISEDPEIEIMKTNTIHIDPITKQPITLPVQNKFCGHIYDMASISEYMRMKKNAKCPYVGCRNSTAIVAKYLIPLDLPNERIPSPEYEDSQDTMDFD